MAIATLTYRIILGLPTEIIKAIAIHFANTLIPFLVINGHQRAKFSWTVAGGLFKQP